MHGFYKANGGCGYVKKPDFLMQSEPEVFDPKKPQPVKKTLKVWLYLDMCSVLFAPLEIRVKSTAAFHSGKSVHG